MIYDNTSGKEDAERGPTRNKAISRDRQVLGGVPVFAGTRAPIRILIEHLEAGDRLEDFLESYPTVTRDQTVCALLKQRSWQRMFEDCRGRD